MSPTIGAVRLSPFPYPPLLVLNEGGDTSRMMCRPISLACIAYLGHCE